MENRIFATYDSEGQYIGFYHTEFFNIDDVPTPNIELTEAQWSETFDVRCLVVNGVHTVVPLSNDEINQQRLVGLRYERDKLLRESDWTQMVSDIPLSEYKKEEWKTYRQALRDLPQTVDLEDIVFPSRPI